MKRLSSTEILLVLVVVQSIFLTDHLVKGLIKPLHERLNSVTRRMLKNSLVKNITSNHVKNLGFGLYRIFTFGYKFEKQETLPLDSYKKPYPYLVYNLTLCCEEFFNEIVNYYENTTMISRTLLLDGCKFSLKLNNFNLTLQESNSVYTVYYCELTPFTTNFYFNYNLSYYYRSEAKPFLSVLGNYKLELGNTQLVFGFVLNNNNRLVDYSKFKSAPVQILYDHVRYTNNYFTKESIEFYNKSGRLDRIKYLLGIDQQKPTMLMMKYTLGEIIRQTIYKKIIDTVNSF